MWVTARFNVLYKALNVTKTINISLAHFHFLKKLQTFLMLLGIMHAAPPLPKSPLISFYQQQKNSPKIFTNWFQSIFTAGGWRMYPFNLPLLAPAYIPEVCMDWMLDFLDPVSGCFQQDQDWDFLSWSRIRIGFGLCFYWKNVTGCLLNLYFPDSNRSRIAWI